MLFTIGYEYKKLDDLVFQLIKANVSTIIDVREIPISRKKGYSKSVFSKYLNSKNIGYIHFKELGSPKNLRHKLKNDNDYYYFFTEYSKYLKSQSNILKKLYDIITERNCCLFCYEKWPYKCHRNVICEEIEKMDNNGLEIEHLQ